MKQHIQKIANHTKGLLSQLDTSKRRNLLITLFILFVLPLLIIVSLQVQNLIQRASPNGAVQITLDGKEIVNGAVITKTYIKLKATQPTGWQIASLPSQNNYSLVKQANAQVACPTTPGEPGLTTTYGTITYDSCVDNAEGPKKGTNTNGTLCQDSSATKFRCYFWQNPTGCISGTNENDFNYYCPAKTAAPTATTAPANPPVCPKGDEPGITTTYGTKTYDTCIDNKGGVKDANRDTLCTDTSATQFRCYFSRNPLCTSSSENAFNYYCPTKAATTIPTRPTATTAQQRTALPTASPTPVISLQTVIIENIDGGSQGSPKQQFDKGSDAGKNMLAQLLSGTFDWQLNPYATGNTRKVKVTFIDQTGQNQVSTEISVIMKASVKILNADNSLPQNNKASNPKVKLVINGTDLLASKTDKKSLVQTAYAQVKCGNKQCNPEDKCLYVNKILSCVPPPTPTTNPCSKPCDSGYHCAFAGGGARGQYCAPDPTTPTPFRMPQLPTATSTPQSQNCSGPEGEHGNRFYTCTTSKPESPCDGVNQRGAVGRVCNNGRWVLINTQGEITCVDASECFGVQSQPTTPPNQPPGLRATAVPGRPNPPAGGGNSPSCPQSGDTCIYSEPDGRCFSGTGATGFNVPGCNFSCGPIACPGGNGGGDDQPPLPPVGEPPTDTGGNDQPGTPYAPKQPTIVIRNADSGTGGSPDREIPLTAGDITIDEWMLNAPGGSSLRTVQTIFKNANGEIINVVNAFVHL